MTAFRDFEKSSSRIPPGGVWVGHSEVGQGTRGDPAAGGTRVRPIKQCPPKLLLTWRSVPVKVEGGLYLSTLPLLLRCAHFLFSHGKAIPMIMSTYLDLGLPTEGPQL